MGIEQRKSVGFLETLWEKLTRPAASITNKNDRRQARLLSTVLLLLIILTILIGIGPEVGNGFLIWQREDFPIEVLTFFLLIGLYVLSRTPRYTLTAALTVLTVSAAVLAAATLGGNQLALDLFTYWVVPVLLSSMLLPNRFTAALIAGQTAIMLLLPVIDPSADYDHSWIFYVSAVSVLILFVTLYRTRNEQRRRAELADSEARYRRLVELSPLMVAVQRNSLIEYINPAGAAMLGTASPGDLIGKRLSSFRHPDSRELLLSDIQAVLEGKRPRRLLEQRYVRLDGQTIDLEITMTDLNYQDQPATQVIGQDITEKKRAEQALRRSEENNRALLDAIPDMMFRFSHDGRILYFRGVESWINPDAFLTRSIQELMPHKYDRVMQCITQALQTREIQVMDFGHAWGEDTVYYEARYVASADDEVTVIVRDISDRKRAEAAQHRRDAILSALAYVSERLLKSIDLEAVIPDVLGQMGQVMQVSRIYLFENITDHDGTMCMRQRFEWVAPGCTPQINNPALQHMPYISGGFERWRRLLADSTPIYGIVDTFPAPEQAVLAPQDIQSIAIVPVFSGDEWWGFLGFDDCEHPRDWSPVEIEALRNIAGMLGAAVSRQRSETAERDQRQLAEALRDVAMALNKTLNLDEVLDYILANIGRVVPHAAANIMLLEDDVMHVVRYQGYDRWQSDDWIRDQRVHLSERPQLLVLQNNPQPLITHDTHNDPTWVRYPETDWIRSFLSAPIHTGQWLIGLINLSSDQVGAFNRDSAERLQAFADQLAVAIRNAQLYEETERSAYELAALYRSMSLYTSLPLSVEMSFVGEQLAKTVVQELAKVDCGVMLLDPDTGEFTRLGRAGEYQVQARRQLTLDGPGLVPAAARLGEAVYAPDVTLDDRYIPGDTRTRSELALPLKTSQGVIGVLDLQSTEIDAFKSLDRRILAAFAERIGAALENRLLYAEIRRYTDELERRVVERTTDLSVRNAVSETLSSSLDTNEMLFGVLRTTAEQLKVVGGGIYLLSDDSASLQMAAYYGVSPEILGLVTGFNPNAHDDSWGQQNIGNLTEQTGISAVLSVPIWRQEQIQGVITMVHDQPRPWNSDEMRMLDSIGRQIGVALANARLYSEAVNREAHIRTILSSVADALLVFDQNETPILINPAAESLFGFYPASLGGPARVAVLLWDWLKAHGGLSALDTSSSEFMLPAAPLVNLDDLHSDFCPVADCPAADRSDLAWPCWLSNNREIEQFSRTCAAYQRITRRAIQPHSAAIYDAGGAFLGTVIVLRDVTYYRELDELKGRFVSTVSHELRTPLSTVLLQVSTLKKYYDRFADAERREMLNEITEQAQVLRELVEDVLELSRFDARRYAPDKQRFDMAEQCRSMVNSMRTVIQERQLNVDMSGCTGPCVVLGDISQLMRVFHNLFSNAIKYTPDGGQVTVALHQENGETRLTVQDTGIGISQDEQAYVFDRFFRSEEASRIASGTGLGLAITKEIIELHGGHIDLHSAPGEGSTFHVCLPTEAASAALPERDSDSTLII